jgi:hypothetical protein
MAKAQRCLMCAEELYTMTNYGEPADGVWPPLVEDEKYGTLIVYSHCEAEPSRLSTRHLATRQCAVSACSSRGRSAKNGALRRGLPTQRSSFIILHPPLALTL